MASAFTDLLGRFASLTVRRLGPHGASLATAPDVAETLLLPGREVPAGTQIGQALRVFVYNDSEDRPIATLIQPRLTLGEVTFLRATDLTNFGAFFDWGLAKELLVSKREQTRAVQVGERHPIGLVLDDQGRLAGTMRVAEMLESTPAALGATPGAWLEGEAWRFDPAIGLFVILQKSGVGLVPLSEQPRLERGQVARFRVTQVWPDGKIELALRGRAHEELAGDAEVIVAALAARQPPRLGDHSSPEDIRRHLGLSKKSFKRALGGLLKRGVVSLDADGCAVLVRPPSRA